MGRAHRRGRRIKYLLRHLPPENVMYLIKTTNSKLDMHSKPPFGPGAPDDIVKRAEKMEIWGTNFTEKGEDYCLFKLFDVAGNIIWEGRVDGY